ncbi:MAG: SAF domain-containing protein [Chloroflexota bacterium]
MLALHDVPVTVAVRGAYSDMADVIGKVASRDIPREMVVTASLLQDPAPPADARATATALAQTPAPITFQNTSPGLLPTATFVNYASVVVPVHDIPAGTVIQPSDVLVQSFIVDYAPLNAQANPGDVVGKMTTVDLPRDIPVLANALVDVTGTATPVAVQPDANACVAVAQFSVSLYNTPDSTIWSGSTRPNTDYVAVERDGNRYRLTLPGGHEVGWVNRSDMQTSGNCDDL